MNDKSGYNSFYKGKMAPIAKFNTIEEVTKHLDKILGPFYKGGVIRGHVRRLAIDKILKDCKRRGLTPQQVTILDAGCGLGAMSVYLAGKGFRVVGVDISEEGIESCKRLSEKFDLQNRCLFIAASLGHTRLQDNCIDYVIGHGSLHHFIKYEGIPEELRRIMKPGAKGYFADSWGENKVFHLMHDKENMERLGDVPLTKKMVSDYFACFQVTFRPVEWFVMFDKLIPKKYRPLGRKISKFSFRLDRMIEYCFSSTRVGLYLSGSVLTEIITGKNENKKVTLHEEKHRQKVT